MYIYVKLNHYSTAETNTYCESTILQKPFKKQMYEEQPNI